MASALLVAAGLVRCGGDTQPEREKRFHVPEVLASLNNAVVAPGDVPIAWSAVEGASLYTVEVSAVPDFAALLPPGLVTVTSDVTEISFHLVDPLSYFVRIRADVTAPNAYGQAVVHVLGEVIHVFCPGELPQCADDEKSIGNRSYPFRTIMRGIAAAHRRGLHEVRVAARGWREAYRENVTIEQGIWLFGGYSHDFELTDPQNETLIESATSEAAIRAENVGLDPAGSYAVLSGFTVSGRQGSSALVVMGSPGFRAENNTLFNEPFYVFSSDPRIGPRPYSSPTVDIVGGMSFDESGTVFERNRVLSPEIAVRVAGEVVFIQDNAIELDPIYSAGFGVGVVAAGASGRISRNLIKLAGALATGVHIYEGATGEASDLEVSDNTIRIEQPGFTSSIVASRLARAVVAEGANRMNINSNAIAVINTGDVIAIELRGCSGTVANNTISLEDSPFGSGDEVVAIHIDSDGGDLDIRGNEIFTDAIANESIYPSSASIVGFSVDVERTARIRVTNNYLRLARESHADGNVVTTSVSGIRVAWDTAPAGSSLAIANNTIGIFSGDDAVGIALDGAVGTFHVANNLVAFSESVGTALGYRVGAWPSTGVGTFSANGVAGASLSARVAAADSATLVDYVAAEDVVCVNSSTLSCAANVSGSGSWRINDLALGLDDELTIASPVVLLAQGIDTSPQDLGAVTVDIFGRARSCDVTACYSIGAYAAP